MLSVGDIHVYVSDFTLALRFWRDGLGLSVAEEEISPGSSYAYARLDFPDGGPSLRLFGDAQPWEPGARPAAGARPTVRFDVMSDEFDDTLLRLLEHGGQQVDEIESYQGLRTVTVADPDGNTFELLELPRESAA